MSSDIPTIKTTDLKKYYENSASGIQGLLGKSEQIKAVDGVDIEIQPKEVLGIVGESGSGKSTLGETILRLEEPTSGSIYYCGDDITEYSSKEIRDFRKDAQIIFQDPYGSLNPKKNVEQIVSEPLDNFTLEKTNKSTREQVINILNDVGLRPAKNFLNVLPEELSGGQRQRVAIARALILEPNLLIADEPMSMLDVSIQSQIIKILTGLQEDLEYSLMFISHNLSVVSLLADRIAVMYRGKIIEESTAEKLVEDPKHPYTQALLRSLPDLSVERDRVLFDEFTEENSDINGCKFHPRCPEKMDVCTEDMPDFQEESGSQVRCYLYHDKEEE